MGVMLATTTVSVLRRAADGDDTETGNWVDPYDDDQATWSASNLPVQTGVRADISSPSGSQLRQAGGTTYQADAFLIADPCDLRLEDVILDERTGSRYTITWCVNYDGPGHLIKSSQAALTRMAVGD